MAYPDIHTCITLASENEELKLRLLKVKHQRDAAQEELRTIKEQSKVNELLRNYVTTRDVYVQTEPRMGYPGVPGLARPLKKKENMDGDDASKTSKLLSMHSQMMRRYEKEVKQNMTHIDTITNLNLTLAGVEKKLKEKTDEAATFERDLKMLQIRSRSRSRINKIRSRGRTESAEDSSSEEPDQVAEVRKENKKLRKESAKLKQELKGLDHGFFEEIEDIKYALQQSAKLNKVYERTLRKMCMKFGVPYPHPETTLESR